MAADSIAALPIVSEVRGMQISKVVVESPSHRDPK